MTDPAELLATICLTTAVAVPIGVYMGRRLERERNDVWTITRCAAPPQISTEIPVRRGPYDQDQELA